MKSYVIVDADKYWSQSEHRFIRFDKDLVTFYEDLDWAVNTISAILRTYPDSSPRVQEKTRPLDLRPGCRVFVCAKKHRLMPSYWGTAQVAQVSQKYFFVNYCALRKKRIDRETMRGSDGVCVYQVIPATLDNQRCYSQAMHRSELISRLLKINWSALPTEVLEEILQSVQIDSSKQK